MPYNLDNAYSRAFEFAKNHYENFPVVSFLVPRKLRKHVAIIYWFARTADDFSDEGEFSVEERLEKLGNFENRLVQTINDNVENDFEAALSNTIRSQNLSSQHFYNLLSAFKQDVTKKRYVNYTELLDYCNRSANPVGRLILELFGIRGEKPNIYSDRICTALQLTNFYQDIKIDYEKDRIYLPQEEMNRFAVNERVFEEGSIDTNFVNLLQFNIERTKKLYSKGRNLLNYLNGKLRWEIEWTILGGEKILRKIEKNDYNVLCFRVVLSKSEMLGLFLKALYDRNSQRNK